MLITSVWWFWFSWTAAIRVRCSEKVAVLLFSCNLHLWHLRAAQRKHREVLDSDSRKNCASKNVCALCQKNNCLEMSPRLCQRSCCSSLPRLPKKGRMVVLHSHRLTQTWAPGARQWWQGKEMQFLPSWWGRVTRCAWMSERTNAFRLPCPAGHCWHFFPAVAGWSSQQNKPWEVQRKEQFE